MISERKSKQNKSVSRKYLIFALVFSSLGIFLVGLSVSYYYFVHLPKIEEKKLIQLMLQEKARSEEEENMREEREKIRREENSEKQARQLDLETCLNDADLQYILNWKRDCAALDRVTRQGYSECLSGGGYYKECERKWSFTLNSAGSCLLPDEEAKRWDELKKTSRDECHRKYSDK